MCLPPNSFYEFVHFAPHCGEGAIKCVAQVEFNRYFTREGDGKIEG